MFLQDNVIFERLTEASQYKELTVAHLEQFATEGKKEREEAETILDFFLTENTFGPPDLCCLCVVTDKLSVCT